MTKAKLEAEFDMNDTKPLMYCYLGSGAFWLPILLAANEHWKDSNNLWRGFLMFCTIGTVFVMVEAVAILAILRLQKR